MVLPVFVLLAGAVPTPVGSWKYDTSTMKVTLAPAMQKQVDAAGVNGQKQWATLKLQLKTGLQTLSVRFGADHLFVVTGTAKNKPKKATGQWKMNGSAIVVRMDKDTAPSPKMTMDATGKRIHVWFAQEGFGKTTIDLVKAK